MLFSHVKISPLLWLHNKSRLSQEKNCFSEMVWYFIGVYIINRTLHGRLEIRNFSFRVENISRVSAENDWNIFQHSKRNFVSPRGHVIYPLYIYQGRKEQIFHSTCTNGPIPFVARPTRAVIRAKSVSAVCIYVTIMTFALAFINVWSKESKRKFQ